MTPEQFKKWRKAMGYNQTKAAKKLGLKLRMVQYYEKGERKSKPVPIPKAVTLACYALACGVEEIDYSTALGKPLSEKKARKLERT